MKSLRCFISSVGGGAASCDVVLSTSIRIGEYEIDKSNGNVRNERFGSARVLECNPARVYYVTLDKCVGYEGQPAHKQNTVRFLLRS